MIERAQIENTVSGSLDAELINYNFAASVSVARSLSVGVTATLSQLDVESNVLGVADDPLGLVNTVNPRENLGGALGPVQQSNVIDDSDSAFGWAIGLNWHPDGLFPNREYVSPDARRASSTAAAPNSVSSSRSPRSTT